MHYARILTEQGLKQQGIANRLGCASWVLGGVEQKLYAFVMILGYSRKPFVLFTTSRTPTLLAAHLKAFAAFGGVPHESLYDNMKTEAPVPLRRWQSTHALLPQSRMPRRAWRCLFWRCRLYEPP